jgi:glycosyltransferase involved in cell wall biosynthesis
MQGGVGDFTREIAQALDALGHHVYVITNFKFQVSNLKEKENGVSVERVIKGWGWGCWGALRNVAQELNLDVLNVQYQPAAYKLHPAINLLPWARRVPFVRWPRALPIVVTFHDLRVPYLFPKAGPLRRQTVLALARYAEAAIVTNPEDEANLKLQISNLKSHLERIPIGSNIAPRAPDGYERNAWRARWGLGPDEVVIGYFGFLHPLKGGEALIRALAQLAAQGRPVKLLHIGGRTGSSDADTNAAYAARVEALARELGVADRIVATGFVPPEQVTACLRAADVCAQPYAEGASLRHGTFMAALAHGRAIVTTRPPFPLGELRDGENMLLVPPNDAGALAEGIQRVMDEPRLRARLEQGALELAQQFTWDRIAARTAQVYERAIERAVARAIARMAA